MTTHLLDQHAPEDDGSGLSQRAPTRTDGTGAALLPHQALCAWLGEQGLVTGKRNGK
jgi:hypothetical protein